jgi:hypothetical protein
MKNLFVLMVLLSPVLLFAREPDTKKSNDALNAKILALHKIYDEYYNKCILDRSETICSLQEEIKGEKKGADCKKNTEAICKMACLAIVEKTDSLGAAI